MADVQPPPTFADVILVNEQTKRASFNPIWLKWFIDLANTLNASGGTLLTHNDVAGIQGGITGERYHLSQAQQALVAGKVTAWGSSATADLLLPAGTTGIASLRIPHGAAPSSPVNGDIWTTTAGLFIRINGATVGPLT